MFSTFLILHPLNFASTTQPGTQIVDVVGQPSHRTAYLTPICLQEFIIITTEGN